MGRHWEKVLSVSPWVLIVFSHFMKEMASERNTLIKPMHSRSLSRHARSFENTEPFELRGVGESLSGCSASGG